MRRIFIEQEKCDGCKNCSLACMQAHRDDEGTIYDLDLTDRRHESRNTITQLGARYIPLFCRHCDAPECLASCMSGALYRDPVSGHVLYEEERCGACFMCVMNCPYGVIKPDRLTRGKVVKCDFCVRDEGNPNCVKSCPKKAIYVEEVRV